MPSPTRSVRMVLLGKCLVFLFGQVQLCESAGYLHRKQISVFLILRILEPTWTTSNILQASFYLLYYGTEFCMVFNTSCSNNALVFLTCRIYQTKFSLSILLSIPQYREQTVGSLSSAMWCSMFMQIYAVYWLRPASSVFSLVRTCNWLASIMVMRCVMWHALTHKFQLSGPTVYPCTVSVHNLKNSLIIDEQNSK